MGSREREIDKRNLSFTRELPTRPEQPTPPNVILASESQRRKIAAKHIFPFARLSSIPGGEEPQSNDLVFIANKKLDHAMPWARQTIIESPERRGIVISTDVKLFTLGIYDEPGVKDKGKPQNPEEVREIFEEMYVAARVTEQDPYYFIRSSSAIVDFSTKQEYRKSYQPNFTGVRLDPEIIGYFSTQQGFDKYLEELNGFFQGQSYLNNGLRMPANITDITGGLDLPVLARMGAVKSISFEDRENVTRDDIEFPVRLKKAIFNSTVGFNSRMIKPYEPLIEEKIENWPWLQTITDYALKSPPPA